MSTSLELRVLGELEVLRGGAPLTLPPSKKARALLAYLVLVGRAQRRERLSSLLWDVTDDPRGALRWSLSRLRPLVNEKERTRIVADREGVAFERLGAFVDLDAVQGAMRDPDAVSTEALETLANRFRGELLEGLDHPDFDDYQGWLVALREEARRLRADLASLLVGRHDGSPENAIPHARTLVRLDPLDEARRAQLMGLLVSAGRAAEAEQQLDAAKRVLAEMGRSPGPLLVEAKRGLRSQPGPRVNVLEPETPGAHAASPETVEAPFDAFDRPSHSLLGGSPLLRTTVHGVRLFGRDDERARLEALLDAAKARSRAHVLVLSGEPGVGKSRLLVEAIALTRRRRGAVLDGAAFEAEARRPYGPWVDLLRRLPPTMLETEGGPDLGPLLPELGGEAVDGTESSRDRLFAAVASLLEARAEARSPLLVALDDVQWLDPASCELLHFLVRSVADRPVLFVLTARQAELADNTPLLQTLRRIRRDRALDEVTVPPLEREATRALIAEVDPDLDADSLAAEVAGNPLFALELVRAGGDPSGGSVAALVRDRVEQLDPDCATVLRWAAVLGQSFSLSLLEPLVGLDPDELVRALETLELHALLEGVVDAHDPGGRYRFAHEIVRRVVYADLSHLRRRRMHRRAAERLAGTDATQADAAGIAHHSLAAGDAALAVSACVKAGWRAFRVFANADAYALARRGIACVDQLPEPDRTRQRIELEQLALQARPPQDVLAAAADLEALAAHALDVGAPEHAAVGYHVASWLRWERGDLARSPDSMWKAEQASRGGDPATRAMAMAEAARCLVLLQRDLPKAEAWLHEAEALAARHGVRPQAVPDARGMIDVHRGQYDDAVRRFEAARTDAHERRDHRAELYALANLASLEVERGRFEEACGWANALRGLADKVRGGSEAPFGRALAAFCAVRKGDPDGQAELDVGIDELRMVDAKQRLFFVLSAAAERDLLDGRIEPAEARACEARSVAEALERPSDVAVAHALLGLCGVRRGDDRVVESMLALVAETDAALLSARARRLVDQLRTAASTGTAVLHPDPGLGA